MDDIKAFVWNESVNELTELYQVPHWIAWFDVDYRCKTTLNQSFQRVSD